MLLFRKRSLPARAIAFQIRHAIQDCLYLAAAVEVAMLRQRRAKERRGYAHSEVSAASGCSSHRVREMEEEELRRVPVGQPMTDSLNCHKHLRRSRRKR